MIVNNSSTHQGYLNIIEGKSDIGLLARKPSSDELKFAQEKNVLIDATPCAIDALVFLLNIENPVENITVEQIRDIYTAKTTNWKMLGGKDEDISAYVREANSGSQELMLELVMKEIPIVIPRRELISFSMMGPYMALTSDKEGIAYSVYYYQQFMAASPNTKLLAIDGVKPGFDSIASRKYPLTSEVYVVVQKGLDSKSPQMLLRNWILSPEGQALVRESGYVPAIP